MPVSTTILLLIAFAWCGVSFLMAYLIVKAMVDGVWNKLARDHPAVEASPDAVRREFQSFRLNMLNLGLSVHVTVDDAHLHLSPAAIIRRVGAKPMSIPWEAIEVEGHGFTRSSMKAKVGSVSLYGPAWCLSLGRARD
jgi:hypothetical protein